ncbi:MAG: outer membrane protein transport protein [Pseudomonadota bacterium]
MKKLLVPVFAFLVCMGFLAQIGFAGGIDNKQNFSARYNATGSRNAAIDGADVAAYNPAGIMQQKNGFVLEGDVQVLMKSYENRYVERSPAAHVMKDEDEPAIVPGIFATYKNDNWGAFGTFTVNGGGGHVNYENGCALLDSIEYIARGVAFQTAGGGAAGLAAMPGATFSNERIEADTYYLTTTVGGTFAFNNVFSVAAGGRYVLAQKEVKAFANTTAMGNLVGEYEEEADGFGWIAGLNIKPSDSLLLAVRYESAVELTFETKHNGGTNVLGGTILGLAGKPNNGKYDRDLPAVLGLGVMFKPVDKLTLDLSYTYYFEEDADWDNEFGDALDNSYDISIAATYAITNAFRISLGYMYTNVGIDPKDFGLTEKLSPVLDANSIHFGMGYDFSENLTVEFGAMVNMYDQGRDATAPATTGALGTIQSETEYNKYNTGIALGLIYRF